MKLFFVTICFLYLNPLLFSNSFEQENSIQVSYTQGEFIDKDSYLYSRNLVNSFDISYRIKLISDEKWRQYYNFPSFRVGYNFVNLGKRVLGYGHNFYTGYEYTLLSRNRFNLGMFLGIGLNYATSFYNENNDQGRLIRKSTPLNAYAKIDFEFKWKLSNDNIEPYLLFSFMHASNGNTRIHNFGHNFLQLGGGVKVNVKRQKNKGIFIPNYSDSLFNHSKLQADVSLTSFHKTASFFGVETNVTEASYLTADLEVAIRRKILGNFWLGLMGSLIYDASKTSLPNAHEYHNPNWYYLLGADITLMMNDKLYGYFDISLPLNNQKLVIRTNVVTKFGLRYFLTDSFYLKLGIKSSFFNAINWDLGAGFSVIRR